MHVTRTTASLAAILLLTAALLAATVATADAGCFAEYNTCRDCAVAKMIEAVKHGDLDLFLEGYTEAADCDVDLLHCIFFAQHHKYSCSV